GIVRRHQEILMTGNWALRSLLRAKLGLHLVGFDGKGRCHLNDIEHPFILEILSTDEAIHLLVRQSQSIAEYVRSESAARAEYRHAEPGIPESSQVHRVDCLSLVRQQVRCQVSRAIGGGWFPDRATHGAGAHRSKRYAGHWT